MIVSAVPPERIYECWPYVQDFMRKAADYTYGRFHEDDIYDVVSQRAYHNLWVAYEMESESEPPKFYGAVVTGINDYPNKRTLVMHFCGGEDIHRWKDPMLALLRRWAADAHCSSIEFTGRKGWVKLFAGDGNKLQWVTCELPLEA